MEKLNIVLGNQNYFVIDKGTSVDFERSLTWIAVIAVCFIVCWLVVTYIESVKRVWSERRVKKCLKRIRKIKINNSETSGKLRKIRNYSSKQLKHEMHLFSIHVRRRSEKDSQKMFNKYFFEIIDESLVCIENIANANRSLKVYFDTKNIDKYLYQISNTVRNYSPRVLREHQSCYCEYTESIMTNFISLIDALEKSKLEDTKNQVNELISVLKSYVYNFKHPY